MIEKKRGIKISLSTFFLILTIIVIVVMAFFMYKIYNDKEIANSKVVELRSQTNNLQATINSLQNKIESISNTINSNEENITNLTVENNNNKEEEKVNIISSHNISGDWIPISATENGNEISLQMVFGTGIKYGGYLTLNNDNTYTRFIGIYADENSLMGTYKIIDNKIIFTNNNNEKETAVFENGIIQYDYGNGVIVNFTREK